MICFILHSNKKSYPTEPQKKVSEMTKSAQMCSKSQKKDTNIHETFKGSCRVTAGRSVCCDTFSHVPCTKKGLCDLSRNEKDSISRINVYEERGYLPRKTKKGKNRIRSTHHRKEKKKKKKKECYIR